MRPSELSIPAAVANGGKAKLLMEGNAPPQKRSLISGGLSLHASLQTLYSFIEFGQGTVNFKRGASVDVVQGNFEIALNAQDRFGRKCPPGQVLWMTADQKSAIAFR